jgi:hypothetical protein
MRWLSLAEAIARAGSFEMLAAGMMEPRAMIRAEFFQYAASGTRYRRKNDDLSIPPWWWDSNPRVVDPATGRVLFAVGPAVSDPADILAIGIEIEAGTVDALWPVGPEPHPPVTSILEVEPIRRHGGGRALEHPWESAAGYVDDWVQKNGYPLERHPDGSRIVQCGVDLMMKGFIKLSDPKPPSERQIRQWINDNRPRTDKWWGLTQLLRR